jgi:hypothetical protein
MMVKEHKDGDPRYEDNIDLRNAKAKIRVNVHEMGFCPLQKSRFIYLVGPR